MADDKLPKCGCGGDAEIIQGMSEYWVMCVRCSISTMMLSNREMVIAVWTRAMSHAQAPALEALRKYGRHLDWCQFPNCECECGFDDAIAALAQPGPFSDRAKGEPEQHDMDCQSLDRSMGILPCDCSLSEKGEPMADTELAKPMPMNWDATLLCHISVGEAASLAAEHNAVVRELRAALAREEELRERLREEMETHMRLESGLCGKIEAAEAEAARPREALIEARESLYIADHNGQSGLTIIRHGKPIKHWIDEALAEELPHG